MFHHSVESIAILAAALALAAPARAHDIPVDATVQAFVKPEGDRLHLLVRVPLETMRDVDVPTNPNGFLDLDKLAPMMPDAARLWISNFVRIYEDDNPLPRPKVIATQISLPSDRSFASYEQAIRFKPSP